MKRCSESQLAGRVVSRLMRRRNSELTPRQIRARAEKQLGYDERALDAKEYRDIVKAATQEAMVRSSACLLDAS